VDISEDAWLSERFGHPVFTVGGLEAPEEDVAPRVREHARGRKAATYQAKVPTSRLDLVRALGEAGLGVVNTQLTLCRESPERSGAPYRPAGDVRVRQSRPEDAAALLDLAALAFTFDRFHLDPQVPGPVADRVKRDWVESYLQGERGDHLLTALLGDRVAGFLAVLSAETGGRAVRTIDLTAVDEFARGSGVGQALVRRMLYDASGACDLVRVGTQAANPDAARFYEHHGFMMESSVYDLHLHVRG
jgi:GNAT superfamily N-acetyltransferase